MVANGASVRLTSRAADPPVVDNPCEVAAEAAYSGLENQHYRVEVHTPGPLGQASVKWSRDNGSVALAVTQIDAARQTLTLAPGPRGSLPLQLGSWVEVCDDWLTLAGRPGELRRIARIHEEAHEIELDKPPTAGLFSTDAKGAPNPERHTLLRVWDNDPNDPGNSLPMPKPGE